MASETRRHRHPDYPLNRCGVQLIVIRDEGRERYQQLGRPRRKCWHCRRALKPKDVR
jgi:hypothetical protein